MEEENRKENIFDLSSVLEKISMGPLTYKEAYFLQGQILGGKLEDAQLVSIFKSLERGCAKEELLGFFDASRDSVPLVETGKDTLDIVGTGGDGFHTINISTMASFIVSACGQSVTKFGNRAATGICGAADVLESLGANIEISPDNVKRCLEEDDFVFLFAPFYHQSFKFAREARKMYGKKTYFNILGPLLNPANPVFRLIGTSDLGQVENMLSVLVHSNVEKAWIVSGAEGLDEISIAGDTFVWQYDKGEVSNFKINPEDFGFKTVPVEELKGGNTTENAEAMRFILSGQDKSPRLLAVIMNAAAGLVISGKCKTMMEGIELAQDIINKGEALNNLDKFIKISKSSLTSPTPP
jgi:anthranilate phosphoribosyltransferase